MEDGVIKIKKMSMCPRGNAEEVREFVLSRGVRISDAHAALVSRCVQINNKIPECSIEISRTYALMHTR